MKAGWPVKKLGEVCQIKPPKSEARSLLAADGLVSFLPMEKMGIGEKFVRATHVKPLSAVVGSYTYFADGDVLLAKITPCFENGKLGIAEGLINGIGFGSSEYIVFRPEKMLGKEWLYYYLSRETFRVEGAARMSGAVGHKRVAKEFIESYPIPVPPLSEQQRIVSILDEAFDGIAAVKANAEKNLQNARALFECHLQSVFTQHGEGWMKELIGSVCDVQHGFAFDGVDFSNDVPAGNPLVITPGNFTEDGRLLFNEKNTKRFSGAPLDRYRFGIGDLVVVMTDLSSKMKILGKPAFVETNDVLHNQRIGRVVFLNDRIEKRFLYYFMMSEQFLKSIKMSATETMVKHTAPKRILNNLIPFPRDRKAQQAIVAQFDFLREETQRLESIYQRKLAALDALKKSLLHQAFSGHL
ncbi:restriction endonuclease subunit S [Candidatus Nitrotoga arctica]|uniref:Restriction endonuclease subunit S n=1 Tax=Candidatus Nitrotoga arctica TaxID=453162 RepID=A0ABN8AIT0_9PROT|nr:restriction endonuclease subunit S [Candidatus Nitrotoga arctica]CAG9931551.1 Restriction endonuclease subunit S [Candidatus Nitrotoga arctica]